MYNLTLYSFLWEKIREFSLSQSSLAKPHNQDLVYQAEHMKVPSPGGTCYNFIPFSFFLYNGYIKNQDGQKIQICKRGRLGLANSGTRPTKPQLIVIYNT